MMFFSAQVSFDIHHVYVTKHKVLRSSEVNEGQPEVSHLTFNQLGHMFFIILLSKAETYISFHIQHPYILSNSSDFQFFNLCSP